MSLNLPLPPLDAVPKWPASSPRQRRRNSLTLHPRFAAWLRKAGLDSTDAILELTGAIVNGHPDRHVVRVELSVPNGRRVLYLKREHVVGWRVRLKNYRAGFGWVSRSEREAAMLRTLEASGFPGPQWLAYGTTEDGRAFLLLDELSGQIDIRTAMRDPRLATRDRRKLATAIGRSVSELHAAGFAPPDLSAKHLFVDRTHFRITTIDWQSASRPGPVPRTARIRALALLHATIGDSHPSERDRFRVVRAYHRNWVGADRPKIRSFVRQIRKYALRLTRSSSVRDQRSAMHIKSDLQLVWLAGEAVCTVPELVTQWPSPPVAPPFYQEQSESPHSPVDQHIGLPDGRTATLQRFFTCDPIGQCAARLRCRTWRSPAAVEARVLFQLQRFDAPAPRLLAFGQRFTTRTRAESFLLTDLAPGTESPAERLARPFPGPLDRFVFLRHCGQTLRSLHDAHCRLSRTRPDADPFLVSPEMDGGVVRLNAPVAVERSRRITERDRFADVQRALFAIHGVTTRTDRLRVVLGYLDEKGGLPARWRRAVAKLIRD